MCGVSGRFTGLDSSFLGFLTLWPRQLWPSGLDKVSGLLWSKFFFLHLHKLPLRSVVNRSTSNVF